MLLVSGINEGLQDVVHVLSRLPALLNHLVENVLDLLVSSVSFPNQNSCVISSPRGLCVSWQAPAASPETGQGQPAGQKPGSVSEAPIKVGVQLGHSLIQQAADLLPMEAAAGCQDDQLRQSLKQV